MQFSRRMGFQRGLAPFGGVQRQSLWAGLGGSPTEEDVDGSKYNGDFWQHGV